MLRSQPSPRVDLLIRSTSPRAIGSAHDSVVEARLGGLAVALSRVHGLLPTRVAPSEAVSSLWLPSAPVGGFATRRLDQFIAVAATLGTTRLVLPWSIGPVTSSGRRRTSDVAMLTSLVERLPETRVTLAITPDHRQDIRGHLAATSALRRLAEEWDYDLALDVSGARDGRWEAEAAIQRLLPRLRLIRFGSLAGGVSPRLATDPRLAGRVLTAAHDAAYTGSFVIETTRRVPLVGTPDARAAGLVAAMIRDRFETTSPTWPPIRPPGRIGRIG